MDMILQNRYEFIFVLTRISIILTLGVFYGDTRIAKSVKFAFILLVTIIVTPTINLNINGDLSSYQLVMGILTESLIGITIGLISSTILNMFQTSGSIIDMQGGFGMAQVYDPTTQSQTSLVSKFLVTVGLICFILNDYHLTFLEFVIDSFKLIPIGSITSVGGFSGMFSEAIRIFTTSIFIGVCMSLPVTGIIFMIDVILGISTKTMPQINIFSVGYIVKIMTTMMLIYAYTFSINQFIKITSNLVFRVLERLV